MTFQDKRITDLQIPCMLLVFAGRLILLGMILKEELSGMIGEITLMLKVDQPVLSYNRD